MNPETYKSCCRAEKTRRIATLPSAAAATPDAPNSAWAAVATTLAVFAVACRSLVSADTWWHLAAGRWIAQYRAVPHVDSFSFSFFGQRWIAHEYLTELAMYELHRLGGLAALTWANAALLALAFWLVYRRAPGCPWLRAAATVLAALAAQPAMALRPATITLLLSACFLWIAQQYACDGRWPRLVWLPALTLLWVQMHAGYAAGFVLLLALAGTEALDRLLHRGTMPLPRCAGLLLAAASCLAVVPLNPNGMAMLRYPFDVLLMRANRLIVEWQPPLLTRPRFYPLLALALLTTVALLTSSKKYRPGQFLLFATALAAALHSGRNIPLFALLAAPMLSEHLRLGWLERGWRRIDAAVTRNKRSESRQPITPRLIVLLCATLALWAAADAAQRQRAVERNSFPQHAVDFLAQHNLPPQLLNDYAWGGYLIWRLQPAYPNYRVLIDGRADLYGDAFVLHYYELYLGHEPPQAWLDAEKIGTVLLPPQAPLAGLFAIMSGNGRWRPVYRDAQATIFVRGQ